MNSSKKTGVFQPQTLDVDETIFDKNLKIIDDNELDDNISGLFPGMTKNENASAAQKYKMQRKLLPQDEYPTVQVCKKFTKSKTYPKLRMNRKLHLLIIEI